MSILLEIFRALRQFDGIVEDFRVANFLINNVVLDTGINLRSKVINSWQNTLFSPNSILQLLFNKDEVLF